MGGCQRRGIRSQPGGIVSLADFVEAHKSAVERDLLTQTGYSLDDVGRSLSWGALGSFLHNTRPDSALVEEMQPELAEWSTVFKTNVILADIYDAIASLAAIVAVKGTKKQPKKPKEYPRSWRAKKKQFTKIMKISDWFGMLRGGEKQDGGRN